MDLLDDKEKQEMDKEIEDFRHQFFKKYNTHVFISYRVKSIKSLNVSIVELDDIIRKDAQEYYPQVVEMQPDFTKNHTRNGILVTYRQLFHYFARGSGYTLVYIGKYSGFNHATVLHGCKTIDDYLNINDKRVVEIYNRIKHEIKIRYGYDGNVQYDYRERVES